LARNPFFVYISGMVVSQHTQKPLISAAETAREMTRLAAKYSSDLGNKAKWPLAKFYKYVKNLPFRSDPAGHESIARPRLTMGLEWPWRDCDDKSILMGAWCYANKVPFKFQASSKVPSGVLHHVYVVAKTRGISVVLDATYPKNTLGVMDRGLTKIQDLTGEIMDSTLNIFEGDMQPLLGFSMRKFGRGVKHGSRLHGEEDLAPELMGKSFLSRISRKAAKPAKMITHAILRTPGLKDALAASIPGASIALAMSRKVNSAVKAQQPASLTSTGTDSTFPIEEAHKMDLKKKLLIGGGILAAVAAVVVVAKKKR